MEGSSDLQVGSVSRKTTVDNEEPTFGQVKRMEVELIDTIIESINMIINLTEDLVANNQGERARELAILRTDTQKLLAWARFCNRENQDG